MLLFHVVVMVMEMVVVVVVVIMVVGEVGVEKVGLRRGDGSAVSREQHPAARGDGGGVGRL
jgi:hypothetical protein